MSDLFEFINGMTARPADFKKTKMHERGKHFFMVNRLCSIAFPIQAAAFNHIKINMIVKSTLFINRNLIIHSFLQIHHNILWLLFHKLI